jgi:hypothetical protein
VCVWGGESGVFEKVLIVCATAASSRDTCCMSYSPLMLPPEAPPPLRVPSGPDASRDADARHRACSASMRTRRASFAAASSFVATPASDALKGLLSPFLGMMLEHDGLFLSTGGADEVAKSSPPRARWGSPKGWDSAFGAFGAV